MFFAWRLHHGRRFHGLAEGEAPQPHTLESSMRRLRHRLALLARAKRRVAALRTATLFTLIHTRAISARALLILLLGLASTPSWAGGRPSVAAICMLPIIIREGIAGLGGEYWSHAHF